MSCPRPSFPLALATQLVPAGATATADPAVDASVPRKPPTDGAAAREIIDALAHVRQRAEEIRRAPQEHKVRLVVSDQVRGSSILDKIADAVNGFCGSMWVFIAIT